MKSNIDLTSSRDFRKNRDISLSSFFDKLLGIKTYPWTKFKRYMGENKLEIVFTGDKESRARKSDSYSFGLRNSCERCGLDYSNKPWIGSYGLCDSCHVLMDKEIKYERELVLSRLIHKVGLQ